MSILQESQPQAAGREVATAPFPIRRDPKRWLLPLDALAENSNYLFKKPLGEGETAGAARQLPRYIFLGPKGGGELMRIGIFAGIHGDEPEGTLALTRLVAALEANPELGKGFGLFLYPICNPTGFADNTRHSRSGRDLNREFWTASAEPEVRLLETEIWTHGLDGIITLHSDDTSEGMYGYVAGAVLSQHLLEPALRAAGRFLPRDNRPRIDGFPAQDGIIAECFPGVLRAPGRLRHPPFEITLETPQRAPLPRQVEALLAALQTILLAYPQLQAIAQNI